MSIEWTKNFPYDRTFENQVSKMNILCILVSVSCVMSHSYCLLQVINTANTAWSCGKQFWVSPTKNSGVVCATEDSPYESRLGFQTYPQIGSTNKWARLGPWKCPLCHGNGDCWHFCCHHKRLTVSSEKSHANSVQNRGCSHSGTQQCLEYHSHK